MLNGEPASWCHGHICREDLKRTLEGWKTQSTCLRWCRCLPGVGRQLCVAFSEPTEIDSFCCFHVSAQEHLIAPFYEVNGSNFTEACFASFSVLIILIPSWNQKRRSLSVRVPRKRLVRLTDWPGHNSLLSYLGLLSTLYDFKAHCRWEPQLRYVLDQTGV